jgi:multiple sugar transport system substrate-binding protein
MDRLTTLSGAIGCRRSTWRDVEVNRQIPFYHRIEQLHEYAREIPQRADWPRLAAIIDELVTATITSDTSIAELLQQADARVATTAALHSCLSETRSLESQDHQGKVFSPRAT